MNEKLPELREKANRLPLLPGVYIMKDARGEVIYVGKAKALKNRVSSYFRGEHLPKVAAMADKVDDFDVIVVSTEFEALVLENSLIKRHKPYYNILLKDDKGYPYIRLDDKSEYPTFSLTNRYAKDGAEIGISGSPAVFAFIGTIQEETHRFAIEYQRSLRTAKLHSALDDIKGVGDKRRAELLKYFGTIRAIKAASLEELQKAVPKNTAQAVYEHYHAKEKED